MRAQKIYNHYLDKRNWDSTMIDYISYYNEYTGFSYFGQAFTHAIAQYACEQHLNEIMNRVIYFYYFIYFIYYIIKNILKFSHGQLN